MGDAIDDLIEEIILDAYGDHEQLWSFRQVFEDEARFPFRGRVVGVEVESPRLTSTAMNAVASSPSADVPMRPKRCPCST